MCFLLCKLFVKETNMSDTMIYNKRRQKQTNNNKKSPLVSWSVYSEFLAQLTPVMLRVRVFVTAVRSPLSYSIE